MAACFCFVDMPVGSLVQHGCLRLNVCNACITTTEFFLVQNTQQNFQRVNLILSTEAIQMRLGIPLLNPFMQAKPNISSEWNTKYF